MTDRLYPARPRQVHRIEDAVQCQTPRLVVAGERLQDDGPLFRIEAAWRRDTCRRIEHRGSGAELFRQRQQMTIELIEKRRGRNDDGAGRQRTGRRIDRTKFQVTNFKDAFLDGRIVQQEHLLDQPIQFADRDALPTVGAKMRNDMPLRPPEQLREMRVPDRLIGGQETNDFAFRLHRAAPW